MKAGVEHVHAEVRRAAAAGELFLREPRTNARDAAAAQPETARVIDFAQVTAVQDRFADLRMAIEPEILRDHKRASHFLCRLDDFGRFPGVHRHRFFEQHVLAGQQSVDGDPRVQVVGHGDGQCVNVRLVEQVMVIGVGARDFESVGGLLEPFGVCFGDSNRRCAGTVQQAVEVIEAEPACSYHRTTKSFRHILLGSFLLVVADV